MNTSISSQGVHSICKSKSGIVRDLRYTFKDKKAAFTFYMLLGLFIIFGLSSFVADIVDLSSTQVNVQCYGESNGSIDITASNGVQPYTYQWTGTGVIPSSEDQS